MMFLIRFCRSLAKKDSVDSAKYEIIKKFSLYLSFWTVFFMDPDFPVWIWIFRIGSGFLADPDPDSGKKTDPDPEKNPDPKHWYRVPVPMQSRNLAKVGRIMMYRTGTLLSYGKNFFFNCRQV